MSVEPDTVPDRERALEEVVLDYLHAVDAGRGAGHVCERPAGPAAGAAHRIEHGEVDDPGGSRPDVGLTQW